MAGRDDDLLAVVGHGEAAAGANYRGRVNPPTASRMEPLAVSDSTAKHDPARLDKVVNLCKRRGFVFPSGEIYGGTRSAWDYGPLGTEL